MTRNTGNRRELPELISDYFQNNVRVNSRVKRWWWGLCLNAMDGFYLMRMRKRLMGMMLIISVKTHFTWETADFKMLWHYLWGEKRNMPQFRKGHAFQNYTTKSRKCYRLMGFSTPPHKSFWRYFTAYSKDPFLVSSGTLTDFCKMIRWLSETFHRHMAEEVIWPVLCFWKTDKIYFFPDALGFYLGTRHIRVWIFPAPLCCKWRHCIVLSL